MAHSTGHSKRLKRDLTGMYGLDKYAKEELIAELAAYLISDELQINSDEKNHANYLQSWIKCLRKDPSILKDSLRQANAAKNYILHPKEEKSS